MQKISYMIVTYIIMQNISYMIVTYIIMMKNQFKASRQKQQKPLEIRGFLNSPHSWLTPLEVYPLVMFDVNYTL